MKVLNHYYNHNESQTSTNKEGYLFRVALLWTLFHRHSFPSFRDSFPEKPVKAQ